MLLLQDICYAHPNKDVLFTHINLYLGKGEKASLIGRNGSGKSTLLKIAAGLLSATEGRIKVEGTLYYVPQVYGQFDAMTVAETLHIDKKINAYREILGGNPTEYNLEILDDDWSIEERFHQALQDWRLDGIGPDRKMGSLSGGQKTKVLLSGIGLYQPDIVLLDEPGNHLDRDGRDLLYDFIGNSAQTILIVSHDRALLHRVDRTFELEKDKIVTYGGDYAFYVQQKQHETQALQRDIKSSEKALHHAREIQRESAQRQQKLDSKGKKKQQKSGLPTISMNTLRNKAENSSSKLKSVHAEKTQAIAHELSGLRKSLPERSKIKFGFDDSNLHNGKTLFKGTKINFAFSDVFLWKSDLDIEILSGERIALHGANGSGKTTLINMLLDNLEPSTGTLNRTVSKTVYVDQDYSAINDKLNVLEQLQKSNLSLKPEHEIKTELSRFLFPQNDWDKPCAALSGGERMRLLLCCLTISGQSPEVIILDEPTNNLDLENVAILTDALRAYKGTLIVVSHDAHFVADIGLQREIRLE
ncbi:ABC-F family ATP-binding cassette domain-containing protein [Flavobacterium sp. MAH-1]|uniref:ABC-F family ATP-binding cassette domain-containing protein n=1 Tax=Flavobacterium agri TaxID=2743471 RepID=A0A7Y8Y086_9FLAO|nr:ABC-F family ATP-binding cassette domain-containing protein [Flavobacterium agri]NUY79543.1 ABC-F family ATP-binding cassette domain-containing protein [Flavobacterium agri]NYA69568.1 ABC-F family ATP-binding cassette domain-containing protein [Flavobacterium agri]